MGRKIELGELALKGSMPKPGAANENKKAISRIIEIDESVLQLNIEQAADDLMEMMLCRVQKARAAKQSGEPPFGGNRAIGITGPFSDLIEMAGLEPINKVETASLCSLLAYISFNQNVSEEAVRAVIKAEFGVDSVEKIQRMDYQKAFDFLYNLRMDKLN